MTRLIKVILGIALAVVLYATVMQVVLWREDGVNRRERASQRLQVSFTRLEAAWAAKDAEIARLRAQVKALQVEARKREETGKPIPTTDTAP